MRYRDFVKFTHRYRVDKDNFAVRRNEIDATVGSDRTYVELGYLGSTATSTSSFEDLQDREELRAAGRVAFARYWSVFGSAVVNLTDREEDPSLHVRRLQAAAHPPRHRLCRRLPRVRLHLAARLRAAVADAEDGNSFRIYFVAQNLGFR